ncbi:MAG TPA: hypothetical protein VEM35_11715, partial [Rhizomicrobium sp.]|nr:hypothetical protein [Rhizomicrobium sp.]
AELTKMPLPEKVRALHPHLNLKSPARVAQPAPVPAAPQPVANPVHVTMEALANQMNAEKSPAEDYILGGADAPEVAPQIEPVSARYPATESYRSVEQQPLSQNPRMAEKKSGGWGFFGRKKSTPDLRAEPAPGASMTERAVPRATAQPMSPMPAPGDATRNNADDLFPDHKRDEQFEIPAFLRRQSN